MFQKILIANRGEIALRVSRTCKELGITPVAVYSDVDRTALHVSQAYESYPIGGSESRDSYLNIDNVIDAVQRSGADAVHPGYGFLAENGDFARACKEIGVTFIGPSESSIRTMGNKLQAREAMRNAGVPLIPGSDGEVKDRAQAANIARELGYPVILKAASGGGGKGMRVVRAEEELERALSVTSGEARSAFGDSSVYIEKYIDSPKHIEIQLMADTHGNIITYGERECSMQRRYQKVIEEAPSPAVSTKMRSALSEAARKAAKATGYVGAGTVEFIADRKGNFYFLEMNTRLQVEHPVTELVYGIDLVKQQILVAAGKKLEVSQHQIRHNGHAIEMRIYAEDPMANFMPSAGRVKRLTLPQGPGVRNENGVYSGYDIPLYYDPMIGKLIVWAESRDEAIHRARRALREYRADGVRVNVDFLLWALHEPGFLDGSYDTRYIDDRFDPSQLHRHEEEVDLATIAACISAYDHASNVQYRSREDSGEQQRWRRVARMEAMRRPLF